MSTPSSAYAPEDMAAMAEKLTLPVDNLQPHPMQLEVYGTVDLDETFVDSIRTQGLLQPPVVTMIDDEPVIISGHRRVEALKVLGVKYVDVLMRDYDSEEEMTLDFLASNKHRNKTSAVMIRETMKFITANLVPTEGNSNDVEELADAVTLTAGLSTSAIAQRLGMSSDFVKAVRVVFSDPFREGYFDDIAKAGVKLPKAARKAFEKQWDAVREQVLADEINLYEAASAIRSERSKVTGKGGKVKSQKIPKAKVAVLDESVNHLDNAIQFLRDKKGEDFDGFSFDEMGVCSWQDLAELMVEYANAVNN